MRDVIDAMPIVRAMRAVRGDRAAIAIFAAIAFYMGIALMTPLSAPVQRRLMAVQHFRPGSLAEWVLLQPAPKMYGLVNEVWIGPTPLFTRPHAESIFLARAFRANHYPARFARFDGRRGEIAATGAVQYVYLRSRYRGTSVGTGFEVRATAGRLVLTPTEQAP